MLVKGNSFIRPITQNGAIYTLNKFQNFSEEKMVIDNTNEQLGSTEGRLTMYETDKFNL